MVFISSTSNGGNATPLQEVKLGPFHYVDGPPGNGSGKRRKLRARPKTVLAVLLCDLMDGMHVPVNKVAAQAGISPNLLYRIRRLPWNQAHDLAAGRQTFPTSNGKHAPPKSVEVRLDELIAEAGVDRVFNRVQWLRVMRVPPAPPTVA